LRQALDAHFPPSASWTNPLGGFYVWATLPHADTKAMLPAAVERGVAYVPGTAFYPDGAGADRLRLAFCYPSEEDIREGVRRLGELLAAGSPPTAGVSIGPARSMTTPPADR
jgi:DNA-binding transcriptional MocR family regulator